MRLVDIVAGAVLIALSIVVIPESLALQFYSEGVPGPGFFPTLLAITLVVSGALLIASRLTKPANAFPEFERPSRSQAQRSLGVWMALLAAAVLVNVLGFLASMVVLVAVLLLGVERRRGLSTIVTIVVTPLLAYLLFGALLQVPLPSGVFGD
jgi:putative tricarboxylic transport membrane protein